MNISLNELAEITLPYFPERNKILTKNKILEDKCCFLITKDKNLHDETIRFISRYSNIFFEEETLLPQPPRIGNVVIVGNRTETEYTISITIDYETFIK